MDTNRNKYVYFKSNIEADENSKNNKVILELFNKNLPFTCYNFYKISLWEKNEEGTSLTYKGNLIHGISKNSFIQGGDIQIKGPKSIYVNNFIDENYNFKLNTKGIFGMFKKVNRKHSNECQFYITLYPLKSFDGIFVAFGKVIQGYDIIEKILEMNAHLQRPVKQISISNCGEFIV